MAKHNKTKSRLAGLALLAWSGLALAAWELNFQAPATKAAQTVIDLHDMMMIIIVIIFIGVFAVMFYSVFAHRKSRGHQAAQFHDNTLVEIAWTVIPLLILIGMAWPATKALLNMRDTAQADITIKATGYQWKWGYDYLKGEGEGIRFMSLMSTPPEQIRGAAAKGGNYLLEVDQHLVVPVGKKIRVLTTATDVIHSWWVPALAVKQDAIPGYVRDTWFKAEKEGIYRGQCAELCGKDHGFMPIVVNVLPEAEFDGWLAKRKEEADAEKALMAQTFTMDELMARGESVYNKACASCHQPNGEGVPPAFPALKGSAIAMGPVDGHLDIVVNGKQGTAMAAFGAQLNEVDLAAVITYERNAWGNNMGDMLQPIDVAKFKKAK